MNRAPAPPGQAISQNLAARLPEKKQGVGLGEGSWKYGLLPQLIVIKRSKS